NEISYAPTRRQILEYAMAGGDGEVLFLDMEKREIFSIKFPYKKDRFKWQRDVWRAVAILSLLGYLLVLITLAGQSLLKLL
ncbi:MAG: hypothetical protein KDC83_13645, partial [Flavobacteriales bacterium]|nr:hypothetical protein [Flavobacteriales bacterium]